ncbi:MAG: fused signal recognition particle receptor [Candidatus Deianiraeaceae bacterium]|jgi:fused signal recognition particle receptor
MGLLSGIKSLFAHKVDSNKVASLKELLLVSDVSYTTTEYLINKVHKSNNIADDLQKELKKILIQAEVKFECKSKPFVIFMYGINGSGKTTTILKIANLLQNQGKKVLVAACDTFRAAAANQLSQILNTIACECVCAETEKSDPASVAFIASKKVIEENYDVLIVDTAGRLHTNTNLMAELAKIHKVTLKNLPNAEHLNIVIMDATIGQNSLIQVQKFNEVVPISGAIITKLDTLAKGGAIVSVIHEMKTKVYFTCHGSKANAIKVFEAETFIEQFLE